MSGSRQNNQRKTSRYISPEHSVKTDTYKPARKIINYAAMPDLPDEARQCLVTVEKLATMGKGTLADSIWALPEDIKHSTAKVNKPIVVNKKHCPTVTQSPALNLTKADAEVRQTPAIKSGSNGLAASRWATDKPIVTNKKPLLNKTATVVPNVAKANPEVGKVSEIKPGSYCNDLAASRWATAGSHNSGAVPRSIARPTAIAVMKQQAPTTPPVKLPISKVAAEKHILPHLRGIEPKPEFLKPEPETSQSTRQSVDIQAKESVDQTGLLLKLHSTKQTPEKYLLPHLRGMDIEDKLKFVMEAKESVGQPRPLDPSPNGKSTAEKPVLPHLRGMELGYELKAERQVLEPIHQPAVIDTKIPLNRSRPLIHSPNAKPTAEKHVLPHLRGIEAVDPKIIGSELEAKDVYLLPHLRGIKEAEQQKSILPHMSGANVSPSAKTDSLSPAPTPLEGVSTSSETASIRSDVPEVASMASEYNSTNHVPRRPTTHQSPTIESQSEMQPTTPVIRSTKLATPDEFMSRVNALRNGRGTTVKAGMPTNMALSAPKNNQKENIRFVKESVQNNGKEQVRSQPSDWDVPRLPRDPKIITQMILAELKANCEIPTKGDVLTQDALVNTKGSTPRACGNTLDDWVSNAGIFHKPKEIVRANQGKPATEEFLDWDGSWMPPVCDWEYDRERYDNSGFVSEYIEEWRANAPSGPGVTVDYTENSENEHKRQHQTAMSSSLKRASGRKRCQGPSNLKFITAAYDEVVRTPEPNPFAPTAAMHLRPVAIQDAVGIASLYNHYVNKSHIPEDQEMLADTDVKHMIDLAHKDKMPFIVAIRGKQSAVVHMQGGPGPSQKRTRPVYEEVIGFASAESFNYGLAGERSGRSRATVNLQLYVHPDHTRQGLGRNLLDHLLHVMNPGYAFKNACTWVNPENSTIYQAGGAGLFHQMVFQLPILRVDDANYPWIKNFLLSKFFFAEEARLRCVGRTSKAQGTAKWLDLVFFQAEASNGQDFTFDD
ncbi:uncharacterized protein BP5553_00421 [Venustampulla echinocandica]|uniref:N-acetyltransferase domain-containing protein n=1 Tax=Venustampulla echinocandica TaxID=2656787 RepID=A0A370TY41_9HELO|nr:uncharacterized protein BP5553_00421 [Venustampulla echinocandica]RDL40442.1 hypothetical protein BP5553_00421 [Venustampulla echinocandica]